MTTDRNPPPSGLSLFNPLGATATVFIFVTNLIIGLVWLTVAPPDIRAPAEVYVWISFIGICTSGMSATFHWVRWIRGYVDARIAHAIEELREKKAER